MRTFLALLLLSLLNCENVLSQSWAMLNSQAMTYYQEGDFQSAIKTANQALHLSKDEFGVLSEAYLSSLSNLAYAQSGKGDYIVVP